MPEVEYLLYATSVVQNYASAPFSNPNNILGAPDGNVISYSGSNNAYIRVGYDLSAIPDGAWISAVRAGLRGYSTVANGQNSLDLCNAAGTKLYGSALFYPPIGSTVAAMGDTELPITTMPPMTKADLAALNLRWLTAQSGSPNKQSVGDAMWLRVTAWDEALQATQPSPTFVSATTWVNGANAAGVPDGTYATHSATSGGTLVLNVPSMNLPLNARIIRVFLGIRHKVSNTLKVTTANLSAGDTAAKNFTLTSTGVDTTSEVALNAVSMTRTILNSGTLQISLTASQSGTSSLDAAWVRVEWYGPETLQDTTYYAKTVDLESSMTAGTAVNIIGPPDGVFAQNAAASTTAYEGTRAVMDTAAVSDDRVWQVQIGLRSKVQTAVGETRLRSYLGNNTLVDDFLGTQFTAAAGGDQTFVSARAWTPAEIRSMKLQWVSKSNGSQSKTGYCDAMWVVVTQTVSAVASRAKRWDGSAWVDAPMKRWDGSQWVTTTVKRWDGGAWV